MPSIKTGQARPFVPQNGFLRPPTLKLPEISNCAGRPFVIMCGKQSARKFSDVPYVVDQNINFPFCFSHLYRFQSPVYRRGGVSPAQVNLSITLAKQTKVCSFHATIYQILMIFIDILRNFVYVF